MFFKLSFLAAVALSSSLPVMATSITQPQNVQQCVGHAFSVVGSVKPPLHVSIWPGCDQGSTSETPLATYKTHSTQFVWDVNQKGGSSLQLVVVDANGDEYYTDDFTVGNSGDASCLTKPAEFADGSNPANLHTPTSTSSVSSTSTNPNSTPTTQPGPLNVENGPSSTTPTTTTTPTTKPLGGSLKGNGAVGSFHLPLGAATLLVLVGSVFVTF